MRVLLYDVPHTVTVFVTGSLLCVAYVAPASLNMKAPFCLFNSRSFNKAINFS